MQFWRAGARVALALGYPLAIYAALFWGFFAAAFFAADFFTDDFSATVGFDFAASARIRSQRALVAAMIAALPAALNLRLDFGSSGAAAGDGSVVPLIAAHRFCCPRAILRLAAADILRFAVVASGAAAGVGFVPPDIMARSSAI